MPKVQQKLSAAHGPAIPMTKPSTVKNRMKVLLAEKHVYVAHKVACPYSVHQAFKVSIGGDRVPNQKDHKIIMMQGKKMRDTALANWACSVKNCRSAPLSVNLSGNVTSACAVKSVRDTTCAVGIC